MIVLTNLFGQKPRDPKNEVNNTISYGYSGVNSKSNRRNNDKIGNCSVRKEYNIKNLCLAGGVALNCVANGKILREKIFDNIWIQPAAGDAGGSLGAALALWHIEQNNKRTVNPNDDMKGSYLGTEFSQKEIEKELVSQLALILKH